MLKIVLAGLVINGTLTIEEAEYIREKLGYNRAPSTVKGVVEAIQKTREQFLKEKNI